MTKRKERAAAPGQSAGLFHHAKPAEDEEDIGEPVAELGAHEVEAEAEASTLEAEASTPTPAEAEASTPTPAKALEAAEAAAEAAVPALLAAPEAAPAGAAAQAATPPAELDAMALSLVEVRDTGSAKGLGLFARQELSDNTWVGDYVGEVLSQDEYLRRYPNEDAAYVLSANTDYNIDAADPARSSFLRYANHLVRVRVRVWVRVSLTLTLTLTLTRYANHSRDFNMIYTVLRVRGRREKHVKFYTSRRVKQVVSKQVSKQVSTYVRK